VNRRLLAIALTGLLSAASAPIEADETETADTDAPTVSTSICQDYPVVSCTSSDTLACTDTLLLAVEDRNQLAPLLKLGSVWRFPVHIQIVTPDDPLAQKITRETSTVTADGGTLKIEAALPSYDPDAREFIQRQFVTALLWEKFFASTKTFASSPKLNVAPVWLVEGLCEWLNDDPGHNRESIVRKAVQSRRAPTLDEVTQWQEVSDDHLLGLWQRSFCFYLVDSLIHSGAKRDDFQQWLATFSGPNPASAQFLFTTETGWQGELASATQRSRDVVYSWDETVAELAAAEVIAIPADKPSDTRICTFDTVAAFPHDPSLAAALQKKVFELTALEIRAHPSWHPILELYRSGLNLLISDPAKGEQLLGQAHKLRVDEMATHQKLVDYINWFEVTKDYSGNTSSFESYFLTAQEMDRVEADPAHPNPIRANLLQVESQF
jgi:hypothetical protein